MTTPQSESFVALSQHNGAATLVLSRPKVNALSIELLRELKATLESLHADPPGALVISGGRNVFAAGAEISELIDGRAGQLVSELAAVNNLLERLPRVTIAAVNGVAFGGGLELALACDLRLVADDVRLGLPEILLGLFPGGGGTQRLPRLVGAGRAKELIFTGREVRAEEAKEIGLANAIHPAEELLGVAQELAERLAAGPLAALALAKTAIDTGLDLSRGEGIEFERSRFDEVLETEDANTGMQSFLSRGAGQARFSGR